MERSDPSFPRSMLSVAKLHPHNVSKRVFLLTSVMDVYAFKTELGVGLCFVDLIIITCYIYIVLVWALKALYIEEGRGEGGSPQLPPMCSIHLDDATAAIVRQNIHYTPAY